MLYKHSYYKLKNIKFDRFIKTLYAYVGLPSDRISVSTFETDPNRLTRLGKS